MARVIIALIWSFAVSVMSPWAVFYQQLEHGDHLILTGNTSDVTAQPPTSGSEYVEYVCVQSWPSERMQRNYFLGAIFVTCYTIPLVVISVCYALIARRVSNRGALGLHDGGGQTVVQRSKVYHTRSRSPELVPLVAAACRCNQPEIIGDIELPHAVATFCVIAFTATPAIVSKTFSYLSHW